MQIFDWLRRRSIRSGLHRNKANVQNRKPVPYEKTSTIGLLYAFSDQGELNTLISFKKRLLKEKKKVQMFVYYHDKECPSSPHYKSFCKKHLNFFSLPKDRDVFALINTPFDMLISFNTTFSLPISFISAASAANFRIGIEKEDTYSLDSFDLTFHEQNPTVQTIISSFDKYILKINTG